MARNLSAAGQKLVAQIAQEHSSLRHTPLIMLLKLDSVGAELHLMDKMFSDVPIDY